MRWSGPLLVCLLLIAPAAARADDVSVAPHEDETALLHNPDMGWVLHENYPVDQRPNGSSTLLTQPKENFEGVDHVAVMFSWADLETRADQYDFAKVDRAYDYWHARGKQIQLRMSTESLLYWSALNPPAGMGVPQYLLAKLPATAKQTRKLDGIEYVVVDARQALYRQRLEKFLAAVSKHFDDKRPVALIDLRGFGVWGEWHSGYHYPSLDEKRAALCGIIERWSAAFPHHFLAISYSHDPDGPAEYYAGPSDHYDAAFTSSYADYLCYSALDYAMTRANITLRRDGVGGAVYSNQRRFCDESLATLAKGPMSCEFVQWYAQAKGGGEKWLDHLLDDALSLHPNYINLLGYAGGEALAFSREQPRLFARGLREMGYRLVPTRVSYPPVIRAGESFTIRSTWTNRGVGRAMRDFHLIVELSTTSCDAGPVESSKWIRGKVYDVDSKIKFDDLVPGNYTLRIGLIDGERAIALPLHDGDGRSFPIGWITVR